MITNYSSQSWTNRQFNSNFPSHPHPHMLTLDQTPPKYIELKQKLMEIHDLNAAASLLYWDQSTYMPLKGAEARGRQLATLRQISHEKFTDVSLGKLLDELQSYEQNLPYHSLEASLIRITREDYQRALKLPSDFIAKFSRHRSRCYETWAQAKAENNFKRVEPYLEKTVEFSQEYAKFFPGYQHIADPLIDEKDQGMTVALVRPLFHKLRQALVPLVEVISSQTPPDISCLHQHFPEAQQLAFSQSIIRQMGYDFNRGRQDKTLHPFMTNFSINDVRITTRIYENDITQGLFSSIHETGHAFYELGISPELEGTPLGEGVSAGVHESQSRLWENIVGRSRAFWQYFYPQLQAEFPSQLNSISAETFYRAINQVKPSLIRTDADEMTYNLHVMIRFDLELDLLEGKLAVKDLPEAWNERYRSDLGLVPSHDSEGVMQDVHWYVGTIGGMFQGYTIGNLLSTQFYQTVLQKHPEIPSEIAQGKFETLSRWLRENIYQEGRKYSPTELITKVTGKELTIEPFLDYLNSKYGEIYQL